MNKKMIFAFIGIALAIVIGFAFYKASGLTSIKIVKSVTVKASKENAFNMVRYLNNFPKWSPFLAQDPSQKYDVKGQDGEIGAQFHWNGNGGKDLGYQEIAMIDTFRLIRMQCDIQKPFVAKPVFEYSFKETADGIQITQDFQLQSGLVDALFMWLFGAKAEMEKTNQQGLDLLKQAVEK
ncbi:MAG: SRPBCC family protein [Bernardetiaceae bacterium]|jgi:hypothetical protein|nr:SRPBCC family protein [Bernardetiaceae bacterium]